MGSTGRDVSFWRCGMVKVNKDEGAMMNDSREFLLYNTHTNTILYTQERGENANQYCA